jgi:hypothetical protein
MIGTYIYGVEIEGLNDLIADISASDSFSIGETTIAYYFKPYSVADSVSVGETVGIRNTIPNFSIVDTINIQELLNEVNVVRDRYLYDHINMGEGLTMFTTRYRGSITPSGRNASASNIGDVTTYRLSGTLKDSSKEITATLGG